MEPTGKLFLSIIMPTVLGYVSTEQGAW